MRSTSNIAVDDTNDDGRTPLHIAAFHSSAATVTVLLERGGDMYAKDSDGRTPLHLAALQGQNSCVTSLLSFAPATDTRNDDTKADDDSIVAGDDNMNAMGKREARSIRMGRMPLRP